MKSFIVVFLLFTAPLAHAGLDFAMKTVFEDSISDVAFSMNAMTDQMIETPISSDGKRAYYLACMPTDQYGRGGLAVLRAEDVRVVDGERVYGNGRTIAVASETFFLRCAFNAAKLKGANVQPRTLRVRHLTVNGREIPLATFITVD